ncbi:MAG TPA: hypothetical protein PK307_16500 [Spirochaetota bacterium]|nr:hypothetical protein [Spirochaetota bacterium]HPG49074.1 hypothetical protein [Spirochaetota bacterium]HPN11484.1 hypothetical protein [Spirochaetota bacterium]HQL83801.1 hypothetical protein [Spirochaetota bacterium]
MPRPRIYGYLAIIVGLILSGLFLYSLIRVFSDNIIYSNVDLKELSIFTYSAIAIPLSLVAFSVIGTGLWIGWTILTIKVVPPMPEIVDKKDYSKVKAFFLCIATLTLGALLLYGIYIKNFWALAVPAAVITLVVLGAIFWVGIAIITTRSTLPENTKQS